MSFTAPTTSPRHHERVERRKPRLSCGAVIRLPLDHFSSGGFFLRGFVRANSFTLPKRQNRISRPLIFLHFPGRSERFDGRSKYLEFCSDNAPQPNLQRDCRGGRGRQFLRLAPHQALFPSPRHCDGDLERQAACSSHGEPADGRHPSSPRVEGPARALSDKPERACKGCLSETFRPPADATQPGRQNGSA